MKFSRQFQTLLKKRGFSEDPAQTQAAKALDPIYDALAAPKKSSGLFGLFRREPPSGTRGLYLWGGVGRGKTMLMDDFYNALPIKDKYRSHFHRFMRMVHDSLKAKKDVADPLTHVAKELAAKHRIICFDEFFVSDIADAMLLGRLFECLFEHQLILVATSNVPPADLYRDGLQRARFLPAIALLEAHCQVLNLDAGTDYRLRTLAGADIYLDANQPATQDQLMQTFRELAPGEHVEARRIEIEGRELVTERCAKGVAWFTFATLCDGPRSQNDYIELARLFQTVVVSDVPVLDKTMENQARRFIALVDEFYDRRVKLVISASAPLESLYQGQRLRFEFERTQSRLIEMRSLEYLGQAHLA